MTDNQITSLADNYGHRNHKEKSWNFREEALLSMIRYVVDHTAQYSAGTVLKTPSGDTLGEVFPLGVSADNSLLVKLPRETRHLSQSYVDHFKRVISEVLPGRDTLLVGNDVSFAQITRQDAIEYRLRGDVTGSFL